MQCTAMLAAPIMGHDIIFTLCGMYSFSAFFSQLQTSFKGREGVGIERKTSYWPSIIQELLMIGCLAWFDNKKRYLPTLLANVQK